MGVDFIKLDSKTLLDLLKIHSIRNIVRHFIKLGYSIEQIQETHKRAVRNKYENRKRYTRRKEKKQK